MPFPELGFKSTALRVLLLALLVWTLGSQAYQGAVSRHSEIRGLDFKAYCDAAQRLVEHQPLYLPEAPDQNTYLYGPGLAVALRPWLGLGFDSMLKLWSAAMVLCLFASVGMFVITARWSWRNVIMIGIVMCVGFRFWPTILGLGLGQVDALLLALVSAMLLAGSRGYLKTAALCIALAATFKLWMAGAGIYLLLRRAWSASVWCAVSFLALMAAQFACVGWEEVPRFLHTILSNTEQRSLVSQSILGFARLHFAENSHLAPLTTQPALYYAFVAAGVLAVLGALVWIFRLRRGRTDAEDLLRGGFAVHSLLLLLPLCHTAYYILSLPLLWALLTLRTEWDAAKLSFCATVAAYFMMTRVWPYDVQTPWQAVMLSGYFYGALGLWGLALFEIRRAAFLPDDLLDSPPPTAFSA